MTELPPAHFEIRASRIHGQGGFALKPFAPGEIITEYAGERISKEESRRRRRQGDEFIFHLDDRHDLDGGGPGNPARFFNHSCAPNCEAELRAGKIWIVARRDISTGEEITFNYGYDLKEYWQHPCACGAPECTGYIVAEPDQAAVRARRPGRPPRPVRHP